MDTDTLPSTGDLRWLIYGNHEDEDLPSHVEANTKSEVIRFMKDNSNALPPVASAWIGFAC